MTERADMTKLRDLKIDDINQCLPIALEFYQMSNFSNMSFSEEKFYKLMTRAVQSDRYLSLVFENDDRSISGGFLAVIYEAYFSYDLLATDLALFSSNAHKVHMPVRSIVRKYITWANSKSVVRINLSTSAGLNYPKIGKIYEMLGFQQCGNNYIIQK